MKFKIIPWAIMLIKDSITALDWNGTGAADQIHDDLYLVTHIINMFIFGLFSLLLIPDSIFLRTILFVSGSLLISGTIYNMEIDSYVQDSDYS